MRGKQQSKKLFRRIFTTTLVGVGMLVIAAIIVNRVWLADWVRGMFYEPSERMVQIRESLGLTSKGKFLFDATRPELNSEEDFNMNCFSDNEEKAVLGCYTQQQIYVYDVKSDELDGILELTTAHELLHAVYARMSSEEKEELKASLEKVYAKHRGILGDEVSSYEEAKQLEEIYVRAGTEIKDLPEELERHYAEVFIDQDRVVDFYESYIKVFREIERELKALETEMKSLKEQIDAKALEYEEGILAPDRNVWKLRALYDEINILINEYNADVEKYNNNIIKNEKLQNMINSHVKVEGV